MEPHLLDTDLAAQYAQIQGKIEQVARKAGRSPGEVTLVAVTKTHPIEAIRKAYALGITNFGENRVQEALAKLGHTMADAAISDISVHLIGHLQRNKVRKALQVFNTIDTIDSFELAELLNTEAVQRGMRLRVLLEVNTSKEQHKQGVDQSNALRLAEKLLPLSHLKVSGLMTVGPLTEDSGRIRDSFQLLKRLYDEIHDRLRPPHWSVLSMGMSGDYEIAIEEGATEIRLGTALFGQRSYSA